MDQDVAAVAAVTEVPAKRVVIDAPGKKVTFQGYLIREVESRIEEWQIRFTILRLYKVTDPELQYKYLISSLGRSVVYHKPGSQCNLGTAHTAVQLEGLPYFDELQECRRCRPKAVEFLLDNEVVDLETDRVNPLKKCMDAHEAWLKLHEERINHDGERELYLSAPAERLLRQAAQADEGIKAELERVDELGSDEG